MGTICVMGGLTFIFKSTVTCQKDNHIREKPNEKYWASLRLTIALLRRRRNKMFLAIPASLECYGATFGDFKDLK